MGRLNHKERQELWNKLSVLFSDIMQIQMSSPSAQCEYELTPMEILLRNYRMIRCICLLSEFVLCKEFRNLSLPNLEGIYIRYVEKEIDNDVEQGSETDFYYDYRIMLEEFGEYYLASCLHETEWKICYITELGEYEGLDPDIIKGCKMAVDFHWNALNECAGEDLKSDYLSSLGSEPYESGYIYYPEANLILTNDRIKQMLRICSANPKYQLWEEYSEMNNLRQFVLLDRMFADVSYTDLSEKDWSCISYPLGRVSLERDEDVGLFLLNYEAVIFLMLADMVALEFMEKYNAQIPMESAA